MNRNEPPNGECRKDFQGESVKTANGVVITDGLRVFTNNLDRGKVDLSNAHFEWNGVENRYVLWFYVDVDTKYDGTPLSTRYSQSDDRVATRFGGKAA